MTTITQPRTHQSWCEYHKEDGELGFCCTQEITVAGHGVELSDGTLDSEPGVYVFTQDAEPYLTLDGARAFAAAILGLCDRVEGKR